MPRQRNATAKGGSNPLTHKLGPAPVWGWLLAILGAYLIYHYLKGGGGGSPTLPATTGSGGGGTASDSGTSGQGSAADNVNAALLAAFGQNAVDINSNLVNGLIEQSRSIENLGTEALRQEGSIASSALETTGTLANAISDIAQALLQFGQGGGGGGGGGSSTTTNTATPAAQPKHTLPPGGTPAGLPVLNVGSPAMPEGRPVGSRLRIL